MYRCKNKLHIDKIMVDINGLAEVLSCGKYTAKKIAEDAGAKVIIGRRTLYIVSKINRYLDAISE